MANRGRLLAVGVVVAVLVVAGLWLWRSRTGPPPLPEPKQIVVPDAIPVEDVAVQSPNLDLKLVAMRGTERPGFTDWVCLLECREREGCWASVQVTVEYRSAGVPKKLIIGGRLEGDGGEIMRIGRVQRPAIPVDGIDQVTISVLEVFTPGVPPEPIIDM